MRRLAEILDRIERAEAGFYRSPWSTGLWFLFCLAWLSWCAVNRQVPGWDGIATMLGLAVALATIRRLPPIRVSRLKKLFRR